MLTSTPCAMDFSLTGIPPNPGLRHELERLDVQAMRERLLALDPDPGSRPAEPRADDPRDRDSRIRGPPLRRLRTRTPPPWQPLRIGLAADLDVIDRRLDERSRRQVDEASSWRPGRTRRRSAADRGCFDWHRIRRSAGPHPRELTLGELPLAMPSRIDAMRAANYAGGAGPTRPLVRDRARPLPVSSAT